MQKLLMLLFFAGLLWFFIILLPARDLANCDALSALPWVHCQAP